MKRAGEGLLENIERGNESHQNSHMTPNVRKRVVKLAYCYFERCKNRPTCVEHV